MAYCFLALICGKTERYQDTINLLETALKLSPKTNVRVVSVDLRRNESRGKGFSEAIAFNHAIRTGLLGSEHDWVVKINGRHAPYERMWELDAAIREGRWDVVSAGTDTRRVAGTDGENRPCDKRRRSSRRHPMRGFALNAS